MTPLQEEWTVASTRPLERAELFDLMSGAITLEEAEVTFDGDQDVDGLLREMTSSEALRVEVKRLKDSAEANQRKLDEWKRQGKSQKSTGR